MPNGAPQSPASRAGQLARSATSARPGVCARERRPGETLFCALSGVPFGQLEQTQPGRARDSAQGASVQIGRQPAARNVKTRQGSLASSYNSPRLVCQAARSAVTIERERARGARSGDGGASFSSRPVFCLPKNQLECQQTARNAPAKTTGSSYFSLAGRPSNCSLAGLPRAHFSLVLESGGTTRARIVSPARSLGRPR